MELTIFRLKAISFALLFMSLTIPSSDAKPLFGWGKKSTTTSSYREHYDETTEPSSYTGNRGRGGDDREIASDTTPYSRRHSNTNDNADEERETTSSPRKESSGVESALSSGIGSVLLTKLLNSDTLGTSQLLRDHPTLKAILGSALASGLLTKILSHKAETGEGSGGSGNSSAWRAALESGVVSGILSKVLGSGVLGKPSSNEAAGYSGIAGAVLQQFASGKG